MLSDSKHLLRCRALIPSSKNPPPFIGYLDWLVPKILQLFGAPELQGRHCFYRGKGRCSIDGNAPERPGANPPGPPPNRHIDWPIAGKGIGDRPKGPPILRVAGDNGVVSGDRVSLVRKNVGRQNAEPMPLTLLAVFIEDATAAYQRYFDHLVDEDMVVVVGNPYDAAFDDHGC